MDSVGGRQQLHYYAVDGFGLPIHSSPYPSWRDYADYKFLVGGNEPTHWMPLPPVPPTPETLSEKLTDILLKFELDEESIDIISRAGEQLQKQEQAND